MLKKWFNAPPHLSSVPMDIIRIVTSLILMAHSAFRIWHGDVSGFGGYLAEEGFPLGALLAWFITLVTLVSSVLLILKRLIVFSSIAHMSVLFMGIVLSHAAHGWFVVGAGEGGMEFSVLLMTCLLAVIWVYWPRKSSVLSH